MPIFTALIGALFFTWAGSRVALMVLRNFLSGMLLVISANVLSFLAIAFFVGLVKAHLEMFREDAMLIYIVPQMIWLALDIVSYPGRRERR